MFSVRTLKVEGERRVGLIDGSGGGGAFLFVYLFSVCKLDLRCAL